MISPDLTLDDELSHPRVERWAGITVIGLFFVVFLGWATFAKLDAAATAPGVVVVSGDRKAVQYETMGVIHKLYVNDGDHVRAGQVLLDIDDESNSDSRSSLSDEISLRAAIARTTAVRDGRPTYTPVPADAYPEWARPLVDDANANAAAAFQDTLQSLGTRQGALVEKARSSRSEAQASRAQADAAEAQSKIIAGRYADLKELFEKGLVPAPQMLELQQRRVALDGEVSSRRLQAQALDSEALQAEREAGSYRAAVQADASQQLSEAQAKLSALEPKVQSALARSARSHIQAPVTGRVVSLAVHTEGGVVAPGQTIMEIVPDEQPLQVEARVSPNSADQIKPGMVAQVRFAAFKDRSTPIFEGRVREVSADRLEDKRNGAPYFSMVVDLPPETIRKIDAMGHQFHVIPGLQADVVVPIEQRTALDYLVGPVRHAVWKSFREH